MLIGPGRSPVSALERRPRPPRIACVSSDARRPLLTALLRK